MEATRLLLKFGLTGQEARLYLSLRGRGQATGYELAKLTGVSRSNAYAGMASLVEKGGAYLIEGKPARYEAAPVTEFCRGVIRDLQEAQGELERELPEFPEQESAYLTIRGRRNVRAKIEAMILGSRYRIYLSMTRELLREFEPALRALAAQGKKVVLITDGDADLPGAVAYRARAAPDAIRIISDSRVALTGSLDGTEHCSCLYSSKENLVSLLKDSIKNEIRLIELEGTRENN